MKYGKTERISGIVILLALLAIVVPWLMSDPAPREERPQPTFVIEQPVDVARQEVPAPQMPESIATPAPSEPVETDEALEEPIDEMPRAPQTDQVVRAEASSTNPGDVRTGVLFISARTSLSTARGSHRRFGGCQREPK